MPWFLLNKLLADIDFPFFPIPVSLDTIFLRRFSDGAPALVTHFYFLRISNEFLQNSSCRMSIRELPKLNVGDSSFFFFKAARGVSVTTTSPKPPELCPAPALNQTTPLPPVERFYSEEGRALSPFW